jgi:spore maturation protein CgeB
MRLIRITTNYPSYLQQFYAQRPELTKEAYAIQYKVVRADCYGWADFWTHAFDKLGYQVWEPVGNAEPMQKAWARENSIKFREKSWLTDIIKAQVQSFRPDIVFADDYGAYTADFIQHLRSCCPSIKLVLGWCGAPYRDESVFRAHDIVFSNIPELVEKFRDRGYKSEYIKHAFEPRILEKIDTSQAKTIDFSFVGSVFKGKLGHIERERLIKELAQETDLAIFTNLYRPNLRGLLLSGTRQAAYDIIQFVRKLPGAESILYNLPKIRNYAKLEKQPSLSPYPDPAIAEKVRKSVFGLEMFQTLHDSKVTLNNHIDISSGSASNMRMFEATGVGTCLLTDWKENLPELFEPDREILTYRSIGECIEKAKWLLDHPQEREAISQAGQARTLKDHTFDRRAVELDNIIRRELN